MLNIKRLHPEAIIPKRAYKDDSGLDLFAVEDVVLDVGKRTLVRTGWAMSIPSGYEIQIRSKSGMALKQGIIVYNSPGTVDCGFFSEVMVILLNEGERDIVLLKGQKIAQMIINKVELWSPKEVDNIEDTERGSNGFGSTGV